MLQLVTTIGKLPITTRNSFPNCNYISYHCYNYLKKTWISGIKPCTSSMPRGNLAFIPSTAIWWIFFAVSAPQLKYFFLVHYIYNPIGLRNTSEHLSEEMHGISWNQRRPPCRSSLYDGLPDHSVWVYWIHKSNCLTWLVSVSRCVVHRPFLSEVSWKQILLPRYTESSPVVMLRSIAKLRFCSSCTASSKSCSAHSTTSATLLARGISASSWHQ